MENHDSVSLYVSSVITVVFNSITCPLTFLLNVLVIMAVKKTSRLQTKTNMLLACLAVTDASTGLLTQPLFIVWKAFYLLEVPDEDAVGTFYFSVSRGLTICSALHLMLVTCERLIAIRFTYHHPHLVTGRNIKVAVIVFWLISIPNMVVGHKDFNIFATLRSVLNFLAVLIVVSCVFFVVFAYVILYREVHRQRKNIKNQQLPQEEQQRIAKENKALKTTVLVVGAVLVCYVPVILTVLVFYLFGLDNGSCVYCPWVNTFIMFNSFINPLIYCWRQKEMRQYVLRFSCTSVVEPQPSP